MIVVSIVPSRVAVGKVDIIKRKDISRAISVGIFPCAREGNFAIVAF